MQLFDRENTDRNARFLSSTDTAIAHAIPLQYMLQLHLLQTLHIVAGVAQMMMPPYGCFDTAAGLQAMVFGY